VSKGLVTIICLCHNHARFVTEALESIMGQTYPHIELIIVDDASTDGSKDLISEFVKGHPGTRFISHERNVGNCRAFNSGYIISKGGWVIDFAADDVLLPGRVAAGVAGFNKHDMSYGVQFGDAFMIDEEGRMVGKHSDRFPSASIPEGDVYISLIRRYFICGTSMMLRRSVLEEMNGFDESLAYEDFDLWIRSSRSFKYFYLPEPLVRRRVVRGGLHEQQFVRGSRHAWSTLEVCRKILGINRTKEEQSALTSRLSYEIRQSILRGDLRIALQYLSLWKDNFMWSPSSRT
jgi:glycosyltransferase involved in cell wall biosynthesis